jgi:hypothetical protein
MRELLEMVARGTLLRSRARIAHSFFGKREVAVQKHNDREPPDIVVRLLVALDVADTGRREREVVDSRHRDAT